MKQLFWSTRPTHSHGRYWSLFSHEVSVRPGVRPSPLFIIKQNKTTFKWEFCLLLLGLWVWPMGSLMTHISCKLFSWNKRADDTWNSIHHLNNIKQQTSLLHSEKNKSLYFTPTNSVFSGKDRNITCIEKPVIWMCYFTQICPICKNKLSTFAAALLFALPFTSVAKCTSSNQNFPFCYVTLA